MDVKTYTPKSYWAMAPSSEIAREMDTKFAQYQLWLDSSGYGAMIQELYNAFYTFEEGGFGITLNKNKSKAKIKVNHFKNLLERLHSLTTQAKLSYVPRAINSDAESQTQADLCRGLLDYFGDEKDLNSTMSEQVLTALVKLEAYVYAPWDFEAGEEIGSDPENPSAAAKQGDQRYTVLDAFDVAKHTRLKTSPYYIIREYVSRYDEAERIRAKAMLDPSLGDPEELYNRVLQAGKGYDETRYSRLVTPLDTQSDEASDTVEKLTLLHRRTTVLPEGRYTEVIGDVVLADTTLPYKTLPLVRLTTRQILNTVGGDSPATSLLSIQQPIDALYSAVVTNNLNHAAQNIWSKTPLQVIPISQGQNNVVSAEKPEALQLTQSAKETYTLIDTLQSQEQLISGINATVRGNPEGAVDTAAGQALMLAQAVQFVDSLQQAYARAASELATITIHNIQKFGSDEMIAYIGGITRSSYAKRFKAADVESISRVSVDIGNPLTQNISGRYTLLSDMIKMGAVKDPAKIADFLRTGQMDSLTEDQFKDSITIRQENEKLRKGEQVVVVMTDLHPAHILQHREVFNDPEMRGNPQLMQAALMHIQEHLNQYKMIDPDMAAILGIPPLPSQQMMMGPPPGGPPPGEGGPAPSDLPPEQLPTGVNAPNLPPETPPETQESYDEYLATAQGPVPSTDIPGE